MELIMQQRKHDKEEEESVDKLRQSLLTEKKGQAAVPQKLYL